MMEILIKAKGADTAPLDELLSLQGNLKDLTDDNYAKLHDLILNKGFRAPIFIWQDPEGKKHILDGHQRIRVLSRMRDEGYTIPPLPIDYIEADNKKDAKETLLTFVSQYGKVTEEGLYEFNNEEGFELDAGFADLLDIPGIDFDYGKDAEDEEKQSGKKKQVTCPNCSTKFEV